MPAPHRGPVLTIQEQPGRLIRRFRTVTRGPGQSPRGPHLAPNFPMFHRSWQQKLAGEGMDHLRPLSAKPAGPWNGPPPRADCPVEKRRRHHHSKSEWESQKQTIFRLYIEENMSVEDVVLLLERDRGFKAR